MPDRHRLAIKILIAIILVNALTTAYLVRTVIDQNHRIEVLERDDSIKQSVDKLNNKFDSIKRRVEGFFQ